MDWTKLEKKHQADMAHMVTPFDTTFGNDMQCEAMDAGAPCQPMQTPQVDPAGIELERTIN